LAKPGMVITLSDGTTNTPITLTATDIANGFVTTTFAKPAEGAVQTVTAKLTDLAGNVGTATVSDILHPRDAADLLTWLRCQPLALQTHGWTLVHAGLLPQWTTDKALSLAAEVSSVLQGPDYGVLLHNMYGNQPDHWSDDCRDMARWRVIINALTRLRFCDANGVMEFDTKDSAAHPPAGYMPWFDVPGRASAGQAIAFGHWSTLGLIHRPDLLALDTGCVWGGHLSAARLGVLPHDTVIVQVPCPQAQQPG
jgi:bis(5'-nucleosyl)-tetraphosphatase (symmetrical)